MSKPYWTVMNLEPIKDEDDRPVDGRAGVLPVFDDAYAARIYAKEHENADIIQIAGDLDEN